MASDLHELRSWLAAIDGDNLVALPPPTTKLGPSDAVEVHERAFEVIEARALSRETPYFGGHTQSAAFNSKGVMVGVLELQHSGHLDVIRETLATLPDRFEATGGTNPDETFAIALRFRPDAIDLAKPRAVKTTLDSMGRGGYEQDGDPRLRLGLLSPARVDWLHTVLTEVDSLRGEAFELLNSQDAVTDAELDVITAAALEDPLDWDWLTAAIVDLLWGRGRTADAEALALAAAPDPGAPSHDAWAGECLIFAPTPATLERARQAGLLTAQARIESFLTGEPALTVGLRVAEASREHQGRQLDRLLSELATLSPAPKLPEPPEGHPTWRARTSAATLRDPALPSWVRQAVRAAVLANYPGLRPDGTQSGSGHSTADPAVLADLQAALNEAERL